MILTRSDTEYIPDPGDLRGLKVADVPGYAVMDFMHENYPDLTYFAAGDLEDAVRGLQNGRYDAVVENLVSLNSLIDKFGYRNLKVSGEIPLQNALAVGIRKDWEELAALTDRVLAAVPEIRAQEDCHQMDADALPAGD